MIMKTLRISEIAALGHWVFTLPIIVICKNYFAPFPVSFLAHISYFTLLAAMLPALTQCQAIETFLTFHTTLVTILTLAQLWIWLNLVISKCQKPILSVVIATILPIAVDNCYCDWFFELRKIFWKIGTNW